MPLTCHRGLRGVCPGRGRRRLLDAQLWREQRMPCRAALPAHSLYDSLRCRCADLICELIDGSQGWNRGVAIVKIVEAHNGDIFRTTQSCFAHGGKYTESDKIICREDGGGPIFDPKQILRLCVACTLVELCFLDEIDRYR